MSLFEQGRIGAVTVPNRAVFRPVRTGFVDEGVPTADLAPHLAARADGGAGLVVGPSDVLVHESASGPSYVNGYDDSAVERLGDTTSAVHEAGSKIFAQLTHPGAEATGDWEMQAQLAPSAVASDATYELPKPMTDGDVEAVQSAFAAVAGKLGGVGFDGVELSAGPTSLLRQFLSPRYNQRDDAYGGDWDARGRFVTETLAAVGDAVDGPVGLHLSLAELEWGGYEYDDVPALLAAVEGYDYLSCTVGTRATFGETHAGIASDPPPLIDWIRDLRADVDVPLVGRGPLTDADTVDALLDAGVDFVGFTRQLLADERTVAKRSRGDRPTRCIECNQKCLEAVYGHAHGGQVECVVDPRTGREFDLDPVTDLDAAPRPRTVLVVGGGPAGLRFAAVAAARGHEVTVREAAADVGGQLRTAASGPLEPFARALEDLETAARDAGVALECGERVTPEAVEDDWDAVVVATGATVPDGDEAAVEGSVVSGFDVLEGAPVGDEVLVFDDNRWVIAHLVGLELAGSCETVDIATRDRYPGFRTEQPNLPGFVAALQAQGVSFTANHALEAVKSDGTAVLRHTLTGDTQLRTPDDVVVVGRRRAVESLYLELEARRTEVYRIGDAASPRKLDRAYFDGEDLARRL
jgi:2,4-dienoyl-CoA reductase (NADPH2)